MTNESEDVFPIALGPSKKLFKSYSKKQDFDCSSGASGAIAEHIPTSQLPDNQNMTGFE